jgi:hypothetical protein
MNRLAEKKARWENGRLLCRAYLYLNWEKDWTDGKFNWSNFNTLFFKNALCLKPEK